MHESILISFCSTGQSPILVWTPPCIYCSPARLEVIFFFFLLLSHLLFSLLEHLNSGLCSNTFRNQIVQFLKKPWGDLDWNCIESTCQYEENWHFYNTDSSYQWTWWSVTVFVFLNVYVKALKYSHGWFQASFYFCHIFPNRYLMFLLLA